MYVNPCRSSNHCFTRLCKVKKAYPGVYNTYGDPMTMKKISVLLFWLLIVFWPNISSAANPLDQWQWSNLEPATGDNASAGKIKGSFDPNSYITREAINEVKRTDWEKFDEGLEMLITKHLDIQNRDGVDNYFHSGLIKYKQKEILVLIEEKNKKNAEVIASAGHNETCDAPEIIFYKEGMNATVAVTQSLRNKANKRLIIN